MSKNLLAIPRYLFGHFCVQVGYLLCLCGKHVCTVGAYCIDQEAWWKATEKAVDEFLEKED